MYSIRIFDFKKKVKDVDDFDDFDRHMIVTCELAYVWKMTLLGQAVCSQYIIVHFMTDGRTDKRTDGRIARYDTPSDDIGMEKKVMC